MIRSVSETSAPKAAARAAAEPEAPASGGFAAAMARHTAAAAKTATAKHPAPKGEHTQAVEGHHYAEIVAGPRNGMYLNTSDNARSGEAFLIVKRAGRTFHVYGSGADRAVFEVPARHTAPAKATAATPAATSTPTSPVG